MIDNIKRIFINFKYYGFFGTFKEFGITAMMLSPFHALIIPGERIYLYEESINPIKCTGEGKIWGQEPLRRKPNE